jgi:hypothetical protein
MKSQCVRKRPHIKKKHGSAHVDQHGLQGIVTVSYKAYRDTYRNTYQISRYLSLVEKVYRYTPIHKCGFRRGCNPLEKKPAADNLLLN